METPATKIDVHHHIVPEKYVSKLSEIGITESLGVPSLNGAWRSRSPL